MFDGNGQTLWYWPEYQQYFLKFLQSYNNIGSKRHLLVVKVNTIERAIRLEKCLFSNL